MPPTPLTLHILLALAVADQAAVALADRIVADSQGTMLVSSGAFYKALKRLVGEQLIVQSELSRRYRLTNQGRQVLKSERVRILQAAGLLRSRIG